MCVSVPKEVSDTPQGSLDMWRVVVLLGATSARARAGAAQGKLCGEDRERRHYGRTCQGLDKDLHCGSARAAADLHGGEWATRWRRPAGWAVGEGGGAVLRRLRTVLASRSLTLSLP